MLRRSSVHTHIKETSIMGSDDLFHKRKARRTNELARQKAKQAPYDKVLIVCEGEKTEPNYLTELKDHHQLNSANVEITGDCGSAPSSVFQFARQRFREEKDSGNPFDRVYCVFDQDTFTDYTKTIKNIAEATPKDVFSAVTSVPCFEYWLLLHFAYTTKPYSPLPKNSPANQVLNDLKVYMPDYKKGSDSTYSKLLGQLEFAKANAERALVSARHNGTDNPSTHIHELVTYLENIKNLS